MVAVVSALTIGVAAVSSTAYADNIYNFNFDKDPTGDGTLTVADATFIDMTLGGRFKPTDLDQLDMNDNAIVSEVDSSLIWMYDAGIIQNNALTDELNTMSTDTEDGTKYLIFDAQTGTRSENDHDGEDYDYIVPYSDVVNNVSNSNNHSVLSMEDYCSIGVSETGEINHVFGTDDRVLDYSNRGVAKIMCTSMNTYRGTGFVVGSHTIATVAHCVFNGNTTNSYAIDKIYLFDSDGTKHSFTPVEYHIPFDFVDGYTRGYDYALITVNEDIYDYKSFKLGRLVPNSNGYSAINAKVVGFPSSAYNPNVGIQYTNSYTTHNEMLASGNLLSPLYEASTGKYVVRYQIDTSDGESGGPIYIEETLNGITYRSIIGINLGDNSNNNPTWIEGVSFDSDIVRFYMLMANRIHY